MTCKLAARLSEVAEGWQRGGQSRKVGVIHRWILTCFLRPNRRLNRISQKGHTTGFSSWVRWCTSAQRRRVNIFAESERARPNQRCGSGIRCLFDPQNGTKKPDPKWTNRIIFPRAWKQFFGLLYLNSLMRIRDRKNLDPGWKKFGPTCATQLLPNWIGYRISNVANPDSEF